MRFRGVGNIVDSILDSCDLIGLGIRNLNSEFLFNGHDNLDSVKRVKAEIAGE